MNDRRWKLELSKENIDDVGEGVAKVTHKVLIDCGYPLKRHYDGLSESDKYLAQKYACREIVVLYNEIFEGVR